MNYSKKTIAAVCDHTLLKATAGPGEIRTLCNEAITYQAASVCVNSCYVRLAAELLQGSNVKTCCVVGFPLGAMSTASKVAETKNAIADGAQEIDMVINVGMLLAGEHDYVCNEIHAVAEAAQGEIVKTIIETCYLNDDEKILACELAVRAGAQFVKTSTGFGTGGATVSDVSLMKRAVGDRAKVKASGGIRTRSDTVTMLEAGASRIGTGSMLKILEDFDN